MAVKMEMQQLQLQWNQLEAVQQECAALSNSAAKNLGDVFKFSMAFQKLENTLTLELVEAVILPMRNKEGGWREDKPGSYNIEQIRNVMVSAIFKGAVPANDEILIISGRLYCEKPFFTRKLADMPEFTDLVLLPGKVLVAPNGGALVNYSATWKYKGKAMKMERTGDSAIPCRLNAGQGADAALGKAERKLKAAIYNQLTGSTFSEGEAEEIVTDGVPSASGVVVTIEPVSDTVAAAKTKTVVSQTQAVAEKLAAQVVDPAATTAPQAWEKAASAAPQQQAQAKPAAAQKTEPQPAATQATEKPATNATTPRQPSPAAQPGPSTATPPAATQGATSAVASQGAKTTQALPPAPKFDASGDGEIYEANGHLVVGISGKKPPHGIKLADGVMYWTNDPAKALKARELGLQKAPVKIEYVLDDKGLAVIVDVSPADFGEEQDQHGQATEEFAGGDQAGG